MPLGYKNEENKETKKIMRTHKRERKKCQR